jgi:predicted ribosome quality control (RQC) complex YloA/Tae2 family protein
MDNLVLNRVVPALDSALRGTALQELRGEGLHRYRLAFRTEERWGSVVISLRPEMPWLGRPAGRARSAGRGGDRFAAAAREQLRGRRLERIEKPSWDRVVVFRFSGGGGLAVELATHGANIVLLGPRGEIVQAARHPRSAQERLRPGGPYAPPTIPERLLVPAGLPPEEIDRHLERITRDGESLFEAIRRRLFGVGTEGARLVVEESGRTGRAPGEILAERLGALASGRLDPVLLAEGDPLELAREGLLDESRVRLLPWEPDSETSALPAFTRGDAAATAGLYHEAFERAAEAATRIEALGTILRREIRRIWEAETKTETDLRSFESPDRYRLWGEAILAGVRQAERSGGHVRVPDPYGSEQWLSIPDTPGLPLPAVADACFRRHRRAKRGLEAATGRLERLRSRRERLDRLQAGVPERRSEVEAQRLEEEMRAAGIPVGLVRRSAAGRRAAQRPPVRPEGVRMYTSSDGMLILVGRTGPANDRLTFKLAAPEDFWLHAQGWPGAHVVIRNPQRLGRPPEGTLEEAASLAAWFSDAREQGQVEVQWTRRRNVRRVRGAQRGTVTIKRFETVRVRPTRPEPEEA